eukprot:6186164-Pleurochrysis_carterae.AAC.1
MSNSAPLTCPTLLPSSKPRHSALPFFGTLTASRVSPKAKQRPSARNDVCAAGWRECGGGRLTSMQGHSLEFWGAEFTEQRTTLTHRALDLRHGVPVRKRDKRVRERAEDCELTGDVHSADARVEID